MATLSGDQFALWLSNRDLFGKLTDETLQSRQNTIISFFGGFRAMFLLCMSHHQTLNVLQHRKLFKLLNSITFQQNHKSCSKPLDHLDNTNESLPIVATGTNTDPDPFTIHNVHAICISVVFTFLNKSDHISLQKTCKSMTITGRKKDSFRIIDHSYISFGAYLVTEHKLPNIIDNLTSKNPEQWYKAVTMLASILDALDLYSQQDHTIFQSLLHSGIHPLLFRLSLYNEHTCIVVTRYIACMLSVAGYTRICERTAAVNRLIECGLFKFMKLWIYNAPRNGDIITGLFGIIITTIQSNPEYVISMNKNPNVFPFLINNMIMVGQTDDLPQALVKLISSPSFNWDSVCNRRTIIKMAKYLLLKWAGALVTNANGDDEEEEEDEQNQSIKRIYALLKQRKIVHLYDGSGLSLTIFEQTAKQSVDIPEFFKIIATDRKFMNFIKDELDDDPDFATYFLLNILNNRRKFTLIRDEQILKKLIHACYSSGRTTAMECCLALSNITYEYDSILFKHGIVYAFQDFIAYFKDQTEHSGLLCHVMNALQRFASTQKIRHALMGPALKTHFVTHERYSKQIKDTVLKCSRIWR